MNEEYSLEKALTLPKGARFYRCALQVNPFDYLERNGQESLFPDETSYNRAIIRACKDQKIEVVAITDHHRWDTSRTLALAAREEGLVVFPGAEVETSEGIHFLLLFDPSMPDQKITGILGECGIIDPVNPPASINLNAIGLLEKSQDPAWQAICVAAHIASEKGLLKTLKGNARVNAWKSPKLLACSLPGPVTGAPQDIRPILENKNRDYKRERPVAVINAQDVSRPEDLEKQGTSCQIKMSEVTVEGLRQAFIEPVSRIRLNTDSPVDDHTKFIAITWQGGFLGDTAVHFNENLNVLIGGRGTGKSTFIESLRYVLGGEPLGDEALRAYQKIVQQVIKSGTKISLLLQSFHPCPKKYVIERTIPNPPVVREWDAIGKVMDLSPGDILPRIDIYGQHEISELARNPGKLTEILKRFIPRDTGLENRKLDLRRQLERTRTRIMENEKELKALADRLSFLPGLEETLQRYREGGLEERLKEQSLLIREEQVLKNILQRVQSYREPVDNIEKSLPIDRAFLSDKALDGLPGKSILIKADRILQALDDDLHELIERIKTAFGRSETELNSLRTEWEDRKKQVQQAYEKILRELQRTKMNGEEFIRLKKRIEELRPLKENQVRLQQAGEEFKKERRRFLDEWENIKEADYRQLEQAAKNVTGKLPGRVQVSPCFAGNREPFFQFLRDRIGGRLAETSEKISQCASFSLEEFVATCRQGSDQLVAKYLIPGNQADNLANAPNDVLMEMEELELPATTQVKLNVAADEEGADWKALEDLSTGQKATAILLLLLVESDTPLVVDQPEDDLDNRFITDSIVPKMREGKQNRQFIFSTHNANIPVLGDAELIIGLSAGRRDGEENRARITEETMGSIDSPPVRHLVEEILEGGKAAFETRRLKYGF